MHPLRRTVRISLLSLTPLASLTLATLAAGPAAAHGTMTDPVSRVSACFAEGPESPDSAACKALVEAGGTQPLYDWNEVNIGDAAGRHRQIIPDGKLCSAGRDKYKGLDMARTDWPATRLDSGAHTFRYRATAPHRGTFQLYVTKDGYDPSKPLKWSDLEEKPFAEVTNPTLKDGSYVIDGTVPKRSGRHLIYSIWQRSDSPEAFYTCSDVDLGGQAPATKASAPSERQIAAEAGRSTVDHGGHGGDGPGTGGHGTGGHGTAANGGGTGHGAAEAGGTEAGKTADGGDAHRAHYAVNTANAPATQGGRLAETGGDSGTTVLTAGGAAVLAAGSATLFLTMRRRAARDRA